MALSAVPVTEKQGPVPSLQVVSADKTPNQKDLCAGGVEAIMATIQDDDERLLTRIGYKQVELSQLPTMAQSVPRNRTHSHNNCTT